ncbi:hypothetical protein NDU88_001319 [Pleurodeles waltl]|uniref:Uncharacterized protein n=1 Tax=Pleurodeles waltl TaxID=8319 RepID=A0AAV7MK59_PLEWA|nr:hypothetical protein NDU88_001319 [Pleurodeles waltl]
MARSLVADPVTPGRKGGIEKALGGASSAPGHLLLFWAAVPVSSVPPLRHRSTEREGGASGAPACCRLRGPQMSHRQGAGRGGRRAPLPRASAGDASLRAGVTPHSRPRLRGLP